MKATFPGSLKEIAKRLKKAAFTEDAEIGFVVDRVRDDYIEARFFERVSFQESVTDPLGNEYTIERLAFRQIDFTLRKEFPQLELRLASRPGRSFVVELQRACTFSMELSDLVVNLDRWHKSLEQTMEVEIPLRSVLATASDLAGGGAARISITSPTDVRPAANQLDEFHKFERQRIQIELAVSGRRQRFTLGSDASVRFGERLSEESLDAIREAFLKIAR